MRSKWFARIAVLAACLLLLVGGVAATEEQGSSDAVVGEAMTTIGIRVYSKGDVNFDHVVDSSDARMILEYEVGLITLTKYNGLQKLVADVGLSNTTIQNSYDPLPQSVIDSTDARLVLQKEVGLIDRLGNVIDVQPFRFQNPYANN